MKVVKMFYAEYLSTFLPLARGMNCWDILSTKAGVLTISMTEQLADALGY